MGVAQWDTTVKDYCIGDIFNWICLDIKRKSCSSKFVMIIIFETVKNSKFKQRFRFLWLIFSNEFFLPDYKYNSIFHSI